MDDPSRLGPEQRRRALDRLADEPFDVVIVGGGITGAGCALDAASRGLRVALLEQRDLASGTSSRSSKLIHGGLRYLEQLDLHLVREALHERGLLLRLAPHLVHPVPFVYPFRHRVWERAYVGAGVLLYDTLAAFGGNPLPRHRHLGRRGLLEEFAALAADRFAGGVRYFDAGTDDARFTLAVARTAASLGATIATSVRVTGFVRPEGRRIGGVAATDLESGRNLTVRSRVVISAAGVWTDAVERLAGDPRQDVTASKGIHLVVPRDRIPARSGLITRTEKSVLFVIPFGAYWLIGTTDTPWDLGLAHPAASRSDITYLLDHVNALLADPLTEEDVVGVYAGLRPLVRGDAASTVKLSREHVVARHAPGLVTIAGGKFTTYRVMAADAVDEAADDLAGRTPRSATATIPLLGAAGYGSRVAHTDRIAAESGLPTAQVRRLLDRYGDRIDDLLATIGEDPALAEPLPGGAGELGVEIRYAASHEGALHLDDVLTRRTRISIEVPDRGLAAAEPAAAIMAKVLGWDPATVARELEHYRARVAAERESNAMPDDRTADAARMGAPDVRTGAD